MARVIRDDGVVAERGGPVGGSISPRESRTRVPPHVEQVPVVVAVVLPQKGHTMSNFVLVTGDLSS
jgi:hypothetical protein